MGFLYSAVEIPKSLTLTFLLNFFTHARFIFVSALTHIGLHKPPPESNQPNNSTDNNYILIVDPTSPSLVPMPLHAVIAAVKNKVPIVQYREEDELHEQKRCSICLECLELGDDVRDLCNCGHLFHRECLDNWIDEGQITCPLCRSMLLSPKAILLSRRCNFQNRDVVDAHLVST